MKITKSKTLTASAVIGLNRGYSDEKITNEKLKDAILIAQQMVKNTKRVLLTVKLTQCEILFLGQDEPSVTLDFINYPKFPYEEDVWKNAILLFIKNIMRKLEQNRTVIIFQDETLMFDNSEKINPKINIT